MGYKNLYGFVVPIPDGPGYFTSSFAESMSLDATFSDMPAFLESLAGSALATEFTVL